jgi:hypothetical protein
VAYQKIVSERFCNRHAVWYEDDDGSMLVWCQGRVVAFIKESIDKHVYVKIEWSDKCVRDGDLKITINQLKKTKWNPNVPVGWAWREDLYHKLMHKGYIFNWKQI